MRRPSEPVQPDGPDRLDATGRFGHTLLAGAELGRQDHGQFPQHRLLHEPRRRTSRLSTCRSPTRPSLCRSRSVRTPPIPTITEWLRLRPFTRRIRLRSGEHVQAVVGLRFDSFNVDFRTIGRDGLQQRWTFSPRLGLIYKPITPVSLRELQPHLSSARRRTAFVAVVDEPGAGSGRVSQLRGRGQVGSRARAGVHRGAYRLDRSNVIVPDPIDPALILVDAQRTKGLELGLQGESRARGA